MYSIIGHTLLNNGKDVLVGDPAVCEFYDRLISISEANKKLVRITELPSGGYYSYHRSSAEAPTFAKDLFFLHDSLQPEDSFQEKDLGIICVSLSSSLFICEEDKAFDAGYTYFALEDEALYDTTAIIKILKSKHTLLFTEEALMELCQAHSADGYISGNDICSVTGTEQMPDFLRRIPSTHWSADISRRLSYVPAIPLIGGVASNAYSEFVHVYAVYKDGLFSGIRISLETDEAF